MSFSAEKPNKRSAPRYWIEVPLELDGRSSPSACSTRDISRDGVFVVTDQPFPEQSQIQFTMKLQSPDLPQEIQVRCTGTVIRVESLDGRDLGMAATIDSYRFLHCKK